MHRAPFSASAIRSSAWPNTRYRFLLKKHSATRLFYLFYSTKQVICPWKRPHVQKKKGTVRLQTNDIPSHMLLTWKIVSRTCSSSCQQVGRTRTADFYEVRFTTYGFGNHTSCQLLWMFELPRSIPGFMFWCGAFWSHF